MKITIEAGGEPNPRIVAFKAFVRRNKKRIIAGIAALLVLIVAMWVYSAINEEERRSKYWELRWCLEERGTYDDYCQQFNEKSNSFNPKAHYSPSVPGASTSPSPR